jgi:hypothetical protein
MVSAAALLAATLVSAQPGYGPGYGGGPGGPGYGPGYGCGAQAGCPGFNGGAGPGAGPRFGGMGGWGGLMTDEERIEMRNRMRSFKSLEECKAYFEQLRALIDARARSQGITPGPGPRADRCERMAAHGMF